MDGYLEEKNMPEINKGSLVSHIILWVIIIGIGFYLIYSATHTQTENNKYAPGATINDNHSTRWPFTIDLNFGCSRVGLDSPMKKETKLEIKK